MTHPNVIIATHDNDEIRLWSLIISLIFLVLGILNSKLLTPLNKLWMRFGLLLGRIVSPIIMGIIYFFVVTPTGLIMKIFRKDLLSLKKNEEKSYCIEKNCSYSFRFSLSSFIF